MFRPFSLIAAGVLLVGCARPTPYVANEIVPVRSDTSWTVHPEIIRQLQALGYVPYPAEGAVQRMHEVGLETSLGAGEGLVYAEKHRGCGLLGIVGCKRIDVLIVAVSPESPSTGWPVRDRKSTRLNSSHLVISYAVFCLKKKKKLNHRSRSSSRRSAIRTSASSHSYT